MSLQKTTLCLDTYLDRRVLALVNGTHGSAFIKKNEIIHLFKAKHIIEIEYNGWYEEELIPDEWGIITSVRREKIRSEALQIHYQSVTRQSEGLMTFQDPLVLRKFFTPLTGVSKVLYG